MIIPYTVEPTISIVKHLKENPRNFVGRHFNLVIIIQFAFMEVPERSLSDQNSSAFFFFTKGRKTECGEVVASSETCNVSRDAQLSGITGHIRRNTNFVASAKELLTAF